MTLGAAAILIAAGCGSATPSGSAAAAHASPSGPPAAVTRPSPGAGCAAATTPASHDWNERTWYEVFVRSFADSDGDGIGDLKGLTAKLDYPNDGDPATTTDLGVGGLWLMPIAESPSYHGYDVTDYRRVEPDYGTRADLDAFLAAPPNAASKALLVFFFNTRSTRHP